MKKFYFYSLCLLILSSAPLIGAYNSNPDSSSALNDSLHTAASSDFSARNKNDVEIKFLYPHLNQHISYGKLPVVWKSSSMTKQAGRNWNIQWSPDFGQTWINIDSVSINDNIYEWQINNFTLPPEYIQLRLVNSKNNSEFFKSDVIAFDVSPGVTKPFSNTLQDISFAIGANFSFLDGTKVNGLYLGLDTYLPKIWSVCFLNWGLDFLLEQGVSTTRDTTIEYNTEGRVRTENTIENKRIALSSSFLTSFGRVDNLQLAFTLEARQCNKKIQSKISQTVKEQDQTKTVTNTTSLSESNILFFWGGGIIYRQIISDFDIKFSFSIFSNIIQDRKPYFVARFHLLETISGIKFGTEVRGPFFDWQAPSPHEIFFYVAKELSIRDLYRTFL